MVACVFFFYYCSAHRYLHQYVHSFPTRRSSDLAAWILAGGTHHTSFSYDLTTEYLEDYADIAGIEIVIIDNDTTISGFKKELQMNEVYYLLNKALS